MGGNILLKLNTVSRPIANKYCEGKMKRILERKLKVREIAEREANETSFWARDCFRRRGVLATFRKGVVGFRSGCLECFSYLDVIVCWAFEDKSSFLGLALRCGLRFCPYSYPDRGNLRLLRLRTVWKSQCNS